MNKLLPKLLRRNGWTPWHAIGAMGMTTAGIVITFDAWVDMVHLSIQGRGFHHVYLVPIVAMLLVWVRRGRIRFCAPSGASIGPCMIAAGWLLSSLGYHNAIEMFWHLGSLLVVVGCLLTVLGREVLTNFLPAFAAWVFVVPVPGVVRYWIAGPLQSATAATSESILDLLRVPFSRYGDVLVADGLKGLLVVADIQMQVFFAGALIAYGFTFALPLRGRVRAAIILASPLLALFSCVMVTVTTVWLSSRLTIATDNLQSLSAWVMLLVTLGILRGVIRALRWAMVPVTRFTLAQD